MRVFITGGSGFIGRELCRALTERGDEPWVLTRNAASARKRLPAGVQCVEQLPAAEAGHWDAVVNLAGENLGDGRWTDARKRKFLDSRVQTTRALVRWATAQAQPPRTLISASAIGWYGPRGDEVLDESSQAGSGFQTELCQAWESEALAALPAGLRVCRLRIGVVLHPGGGALAQMLPPFRLGLGGRVGDGRQWMSWITRADLVRLMLWLLDTPTAAGVYNGTAPQPVRNAEFAAELAASLRRPAVLPMPAAALRLLLGEMAELVLTGQKVLPQRALEQGFVFESPELGAALRRLLA